MALVGGEDREAARSRRRRDRDVLEAGIMRPRAIEDRAGMAGFLDTERQDAAGVKCSTAASQRRRRSAFVVAPILIARAMPASISATVTAET